ncbi:nicotinate phosphoribosyltransferase [Aplysia californica]|uniref:Nicotinate phosphoribosyltransferase n=1 Tax=Aplysia californica TaxID=6500 RepID=A0ABM1W0J1_APLCA|nr:nicotinate phosphoribosyltransferase [Aplysia californica]
MSDETAMMTEPAVSQNISNGSNGVVQALLTDLYQITMAYAYWKSGKMNDPSVFDLFFRKNPFHGEFTIFAGLEECIKLLKGFHFSKSDIEYLRTAMPPGTDPGFFDYLASLSAQDVTLEAVPEGEVVFPKVPLITITGPLPVVQLLETPLLNLVNYASLVATNAARFRMAAGPETVLLEFGLRRAQGPDGGLSASRYCYLGGFDGTSNVLAGKMFGIPVRGTHAHAFVTSFITLNDLQTRNLKSKDGSKEIDFVSLCLTYKKELSSVIDFLPDQTIEGELAAFISYACAFPDGFLALIDTYDVIRSGLPNFCTVAMALNDLGYKALGIRLDSGDLSYQSNVVRAKFVQIAAHYSLPWFERLTIVASNDINEDTIHSLNQQACNLCEVTSHTQPIIQGHTINCYGIGTHLVTCQKQPALGCVFKLVEVNKKPRIKLSEDVEKVSIPGRKKVYRLFGADGTALVDLLQEESEPAPEIGKRVLCRHPIQESKRAYVIPADVKLLHKVWWKDGQVGENLPSLTELREKTKLSLSAVRQDHKRALNPTPYKVSVSSSLYTFIHELWLESAPIGELS